jgi:spore coat protein U-like protein
MRFPVTVFSVCLVALVLGSNARAATTCTVDVRPISFGGYNPLLPNATLNTTGSVDVSCAINSLPLNTVVNYSIGISSGASGTFLSRRMIRGGDFLAYNISAFSTMSPVWGDVSGGALQLGSFAGFSALNSFRTNSHTMFALLYPRQLGKALGDYLDQLNVTVYF